MRAAVMAGVKKKTIFMIASCALLLPLRLARAYLCHETVTCLGKSPPGSICVSKEQRLDSQVSGVLAPAVARNGRVELRRLRCASLVTSHRQLGEKLFEGYGLHAVESLSARPEEHHNPARDLPRPVRERGEALQISCIDMSRCLDFDGPQVAAD